MWPKTTNLLMTPATSASGAGSPHRTCAMLHTLVLAWPMVTSVIYITLPARRHSSFVGSTVFKKHTLPSSPEKSWIGVWFWCQGHHVHSPSKETQLFLTHFSRWPWVTDPNPGSCTFCQTILEQVFCTLLPRALAKWNTLQSSYIYTLHAAFLLKKSVNKAYQLPPMQYCFIAICICFKSWQSHGPVSGWFH